MDSGDVEAPRLAPRPELMNEGAADELVLTWLQKGANLHEDHAKSRLAR
jgi:hypothetical protein